MKDQTKDINSQVLFIGNPEEQTHFKAEHSLFFDKFSNLIDAIDAAFFRVIEPPLQSVDQLVFSLGYSCVEDFNEIFLLCGNGYGVGGQKIIRGMYERAVTAGYLHSCPKKAADFVDFGKVSSFRSMTNVKDIYGEQFFDSDPALRENFAQAEKECNGIKERFQVTQCEKCKTTRLNHTWSKLNVVAMARKVPQLGDPILIRFAYIEPTQQIHATLDALLKKTMKSSTGGGKFGRNIEQERATSKKTLHVSHMILLSVLELQYQHFGLKSLKQPLERCTQDYSEIWPSPTSGTTDF